MRFPAGKPLAIFVRLAGRIRDLRQAPEKAKMSSRGLPILLVLAALLWPALAFGQAPATPEQTSLASAIVSAINDAGQSVSTSLAHEIDGMETVVEGLADKAILYLAIALCLGLAVGMILGSVLSSLILRGAIRKAIVAAR